MVSQLLGRCFTPQAIPAALVFFCLFFFGAGIETRASSMLGKRCTTEIRPSPQPCFCVGFFGDSVSGLASNSDPPDLCLLSSQDYKREQPAPGYPILFSVTEKTERKSKRLAFSYPKIQKFSLLPSFPWLIMS
jgi:hypothetical protein